MPSSLLPYFYLAASMSLIGTYVGLGKPLTLIFPVMLLAWLRYSIAGIVMIGWFKHARGEAPLNRKNKGLLALNAFIGSFLFTFCMLTGVKLASALSAGIIMAGLPAAVALLSRLFLAERISRKTLHAIFCAFCGVALLAIASISSSAKTVQANTTSGWTSLVGHLLLIAAVFCEAAYVVLGKKLAGQISPKRISAYMNLWGWIFSLPFGLYAATQFNFTAVTLPQWGLMIFYALSASTISVWLWMNGLKSIPASSAGIFTIFLPISTTWVGVALGEHFSIIHGIAFLFALLSIFLGTWRPHRRI